MSNPKPLFLPGVPANHVIERLEKAGGNELESKFASPESSAALAVNCFGWFWEHPRDLPPFPNSSEVDWPARYIDVEYCARFPWSGGRHPWLDAIVETRDWLIGVESKRHEPFRDRKAVNLSNAYDRPVWGDGMTPFEELRDRLRSGAEKFEYLDAAQLVKHAFGLVTDARRKGKRPALAYVFAEPRCRGDVTITPETISDHRAEIDRFKSLTASAAVRFFAFSYSEWFKLWTAPGVASHGRALVEQFEP